MGVRVSNQEGQLPMRKTVLEGWHRRVITVRTGPARFTLIEVLVAVLILGVSLTMILGILGTARARILRAESRWGREHHLTQAAEFFLLAGPDGEMPPDLFPQGFAAACQVVVAEELPVDGDQPINGWTLGRYDITVTGPDGETIGERRIEKLIDEAEDL